MNEMLRRSRLLIADGAMGTELQRAGLAAGSCGELWNLTRPTDVQAIHRHYVESGADILLTNTFGASRIALGRHGAGDRVCIINRTAAAIAVRAAGERAWVLGDIGPFGGFLEPAGDTPPEPVLEAFREQAHALMQGGVDGIMIETMSSLAELELAVRAARTAGALLIAGSVTFEKGRAGLRTMMGETPTDAAEKMTSLALDMIGTNCGTGLEAADYADIVRAYRRVNANVPIIVKPNAGTPHLEQDRTVYDVSPDGFAALARIIVDAGADIVGGCCGTTPGHIAALACSYLEEKV